MKTFVQRFAGQVVTTDAHRCKAVFPSIACHVVSLSLPMERYGKLKSNQEKGALYYTPEERTQEIISPDLGIHPLVFADLSLDDLRTVVRWRFAAQNEYDDFMMERD